MDVQMSQHAIEVNQLSRRFGRFVAVDKVSFNVQRGSIFGFLGANGAGKSTTIRMLCGLLTSTSGTAKVAGFDINTESEKVKRSIGYMSQRFSLYDDLTVRENITFFGGAYGLVDSVLCDRMKWVIAIARLDGKEGTMTRDLPGGWKQRLALGCAVIHRPQIVFLDEPTSGVDPVARRDFWELINTLSHEGSTVFVTTHYLDEAEYCNNIVLIHAGRIVATGSPRELKSKYISNPMYELDCDDVLTATELLKQQDWVGDTSIFGNHLHVSASREDDIGRLVHQLLSDQGIAMRRFERIVPSLEDVFIHLIESKSDAAST
jgi:ABC-2 type transport system ATP-binding protein